MYYTPDCFSVGGIRRIRSDRTSDGMVIRSIRDRKMPQVRITHVDKDLGTVKQIDEQCSRDFSSRAGGKLDDDEPGGANEIGANK